jgi:hypothetical protein
MHVAGSERTNKCGNRGGTTKSCSCSACPSAVRGLIPKSEAVAEEHRNGSPQVPSAGTARVDFDDREGDA